MTANWGVANPSTANTIPGALPRTPTAALYGAPAPGTAFSGGPAPSTAGAYARPSSGQSYSSFGGQASFGAASVQSYASFGATSVRAPKTPGEISGSGLQDNEVPPTPVGNARGAAAGTPAPG